ncbi:four-helix bundle copper-binding protein [Leptospira sp. 96542]|nr:four-helix bundle copper-binding protein [Leptospira sp. 96542]
MNRKEFVQSATTAVALSGIFSTLSAEDHSNHGVMPTTSTSKSKYAKVMMSAIHCKLAAEICLSHCIVELGKGDKSLATCAESTKEVIALCDSFISLASQSSKYTKKLASLCAEVCEACAKVCEKHANHHAVCKDCMESCLACAKEMKKV